jgi:primosomal replication protein N
LPVLDFELKHESELGEAGQPRKVALQIRAIAIGGITQALAEMPLGSQGTYVGFLAAARNGRGLLFHVTAIEPAETN